MLNLVVDKIEVVTEEKVLCLPAPQTNEFTVEGIKFKSINAVPNDAMAMVVQLIAVNEQELPIPRYMFERLGRGHCGGAWAISNDLVLKVNEINNRADIELERFVDGECLEDLQGLPLVPKLYAYSYDKQYMIVERIHGMQVGECEHNMNNFTAQLGVSVVPKFWNWKKWIDLACEFNRGCLQRGWIPNDLHGENVMIDKAGNLTVIDYGLFKKIGKHDKLSKYNFDSEYDRIAGSIRMIARELKCAERSETRQYEPENPLTWGEFQPKVEKKIEEEAKSYVDNILKILSITETSSMNEEKAHADMEGKHVDFLKVDKAVKEYDHSNNKVERMLLGVDFAQHVNHRLMEIGKFHFQPVLAPMAQVTREQRTAPQVVELQEQDEEVASIQFFAGATPKAKPLAIDWGRANHGVIAIGKQVIGQWRGKL
ncbi:protein kinase [Bacillus phage Anath]|uniref:Protein kinase n=1 Tax=Bacillus phage Anath TaxID=2108114 RepID=A0A2P1JUN7_9CAUD|nr:protein kinase [Bacillus phage Anath]